MAKINDTTTFPNTAPALGDHVPGTDVSNTGNDAAGETVTFTMQAVMDLFEANMTVPSSVSAAYRTSTILSSTSNAEGAALIGVEDAGTYFSGATVEAVLAEIGALLPAEANADVTDTANVTAAGALMDSEVTNLAQVKAFDSTDYAAASHTHTAGDIDAEASTDGFVLTSDGAGNAAWEAVPSGGAPEGTSVLSTGPVTDGYVLTADGAGGAAWEAAATGTPEGTAILSTGEVGGTKFLREDGDGTCSWQTPAGGGDVSAGGSPASTYIGVWTDGTTLTGTSGLTYGSSILEFTGGLLLNERADHAATPGATKAEIWLSNDATQKLYLTDDTGTDNEIAFLGGSGDLSTFTGLLGIDAGSATDVNSKTTLEDRLSDVNDFAQADGDVYTGTHDFGGANDLEIPNGDTILIDTNGQVAIDNLVTDFSAGVLEYYSSEVMGVVAMPIAEFTSPTDGAVPTYNATNDEFEMVVPSGSGDVSKVGTPVDGQIGVWTGDGTIEGDASLTFDTTDDTLVIAASGKLGFGAVDILSDSAGTTTLQNIDALDATTEATIEAAIDTLANLTSVQGHTVTLTGDFIRSGAHSLTLTTGGATNVTLPTTGTLAAYGDTTANFTGTLQNGGSNVLVDTDIGSTVQAYDADTLKADTSDNLTVGFTSSVDDDGTQSTGTYTPDPATGNYKQITNGGAFTLAPPSPANDVAVSVSVLIINNGSAGAITTSGFTHVGPGDSFTTTDTHKFLCRIDVYDDGGTEYSVLQVVALQ